MRRFFLAFPLILLIGLTGCSKKEKASDKRMHTEEAPKIVLKIDNKEYTLSDFQAYLLGKKLEMKELDNPTRKALFEDFINTRLMLMDAEKRKIILNSDEISFYRKSLEELKVKVDAPVLKSIYENLLISKYLQKVVFKGVKVTEKELYDYYRQHPNEFVRKERVKVHQILVDSEEKALQIREKLKKAPPSEFEKLAKKYSIAPEAKKGGDMGWYEKGDLPTEMENVVFSLSPGEISQVVKTPLGYHIFRLDRKQKGRMLTFAEVRGKIRQKLLEEKREEKLKEWLKELKNQHKITVFEENLGFPYTKEE